MGNNVENQDVITSQVKTGSDVIASHSKVCSMKSCCYTKRQGEGGERGEDYGRKIYVETWCLVVSLTDSVSRNSLETFTVDL